MSVTFYIPEAHVYANASTLSFTCEKHERTATVEHIKDVLSLITSWGRQWQVKLAPDKIRRNPLTPSISTD